MLKIEIGENNLSFLIKLLYIYAIFGRVILFRIKKVMWEKANIFFLFRLSLNSVNRKTGEKKGQKKT